MAISLTFIVALSWATGGRELTDDAVGLLYLVRHPFVLWGSYVDGRIGPLWGSYPPLQPMIFGALVGPWTLVTSEFWALRLGVLAWTSVILVALSYFSTHFERASRERVRGALWLFALLPAAWVSCAFQPQEEIYVSGFVLLLYWAARSERWKLVPALLILTVLGAKYYVAILMIPLAFASPRPWRNMVTWGTAVGVSLAAYIGYHWLLHSVTPILDYHQISKGGISVWALLWTAGLHPAPQAANTAGVLLAGALALALALVSRRSKLPLAFSMVATVWVTLLSVSVAMPTYWLWAFPLLLVCFTQMRRRWERVLTVALLGAWVSGEWGVNFFRGMSNVQGMGNALQRSEDLGKSAFAAKVEQLLGTGFPYADAQVAAQVLLLATGLGMISLLYFAGRQEAPAKRATKGPLAPRIVRARRPELQPHTSL